MQNPFQRRMRKSGGGTSTEPSLSDKPTGAKADARARLRNPLHLLSVRLFLIVFVSIVACVAVVGTLSFQISKGVIEKKVTAASNETIDQIRGKLDLILGNYENFSIQFITDKSLQDNIRELGSSASDEYAIFENQRALSTKLSAMAMSNAEVMNVNYIPLQEKYGTNVLGTGNLKYETVKDAPWLKQAVELGGKSIWIDPGKGLPGQRPEVVRPGPDDPGYVGQLRVRAADRAQGLAARAAAAERQDRRRQPHPDSRWRQYDPDRQYRVRPRRGEVRHRLRRQRRVSR